MTDDARLAEIAAMVTLLLPVEMPRAIAETLADGLRHIVTLLPPPDDRPVDRALRRDLLAAAEALDPHL